MRCKDWAKGEFHKYIEKKRYKPDKDQKKGLRQTILMPYDLVIGYLKPGKSGKKHKFARKTFLKTHAWFTEVLQETGLYKMREIQLDKNAFV